MGVAQRSTHISHRRLGAQRGISSGVKLSLDPREVLAVAVDLLRGLPERGAGVIHRARDFSLEVSTGVLDVFRRDGGHLLLESRRDLLVQTFGTGIRDLHGDGVVFLVNAVDQLRLRELSVEHAQEVLAEVFRNGYRCIDISLEQGFVGFFSVKELPAKLVIVP